MIVVLPCMPLVLTLTLALPFLFKRLPRPNFPIAFRDDEEINTLKTLFRLPRVLLDLYKCILSGAIKFVSVRSF